MEHVEKTGIHSGDSISVYPTFTISENAKEKIGKKGCDYIIANDISRKEIGFDSDENEVYILDRDLNIKKIEH